MSLFKLNEVFDLFDVEEPALYFEEYGEGLINLSYRVFSDNHCYVLQKINTKVFPCPDAIEFNLRQLIAADSSFSCVPKIYCTREGSPLLYFNEDVYKLSCYIPNSCKRSSSKDQIAVAQAAKGICLFYNAYSPINAEKLAPVIPDFHNLHSRWEQLENAWDNRIIAVASEEELLLEELRYWKSKTTDLYRLLEMGKIPWRTCHNDAKLDNILLDKDTGLFLKIIDLDTVMKGSFLFDFGDFCRSVLPSIQENHPPDNAYNISLSSFETICNSFQPLKNKLSPLEINLLVSSIQYITFLMATRFFTDYLLGNIYFKCVNPTENKIRTSNQLRLLKELDLLGPKMEKIVNFYFS